MTEIVKIEDLEQFDKLKEVWRELLAESDVDHVFLTFEWLRTWWRIYGKDNRLYILMVIETGETIGIAPLMLTGERGRRVLRFIGHPNADYADFIAPDKKRVVESVLAYLRSHRGDWSRVELDQIPEQSGSLDIIRDFLRTGGQPGRLKPIEVCMSFTYEGTDEQRKDFRAKRTKAMNNYMNFFIKRNGLTLDKLDDAASIRKYLPRFYHCHILRWQQKQLPSKFRDRQNRRFYENLVDRLAPSGMVSLLVLKHGQQPLAYLFAYNYKKTVYLYTITHEAFFGRKSLGIILFNMLTERYVCDGFDQVDFARGAGTHKTKFINGSCTNYRLLLTKGAMAVRFDEWYDKIKTKTAIRHLKESALFRNVRQEIRQTHQRYGWFKGLGHLISKSFRRLLEIRSAALYRWDEDRVASVEKDDEIEFKCLGPDEFESIGSFFGFMEKSRCHHMIKEHFDKGAGCFAAVRGELAGAMCLASFGREALTDFEEVCIPEQNGVLLVDPGRSPASDDPDILFRLIHHLAERFNGEGKKVLLLDKTGCFPESGDLPKWGFYLIRKFRALFVGGRRIMKF